MNNKVNDIPKLESDLTHMPYMREMDMSGFDNIQYNREIQFENWTFSKASEDTNNQHNNSKHKKTNSSKKIKRNLSKRQFRRSIKEEQEKKESGDQSKCEKTKEKLCDFGYETTAHGWGQVVNERRIILKLVWVIVTLSAYIGNGWHISLLVTQYLNYPTEQVARVKFTAIEFPSITICNIQPMSFSTGLDILSNTSSKLYQWTQITDTYFENNNASMLGLTDDQYEYLYNRLRQPVGYFENIGDEAIVIGQQISDFLIRCTYPDEICSQSNFSFYQNPTYFNCFTFNGGNLSDDDLITKTTGPQKGLSMILYLESDNGDMLYNGTYHTLSNIGNAAGIRVVIHPPDSLPTPVDNGFDVPPGTSSSVGIKVSRADRLDPPIGECKKNKTSFSDKYVYSQQACLLLCQQSHVMKNCFCISSQLPIPFDLDNLRYCGQFNISDPQFFFDNLSCEARVTQEFAINETLRNSCECLPLCEESAYETEVSYSYWPLDYVQEDFYEKYVINNPDRDTLKAYNNLKRFNITELIQNGLIRKNFVRLNVYLKDLIVEEVIQKRTYELQNLFSDMGGTFGLWIGVSILSWFEIFELLVKLTVFWLRAAYERVHSGKNNVLCHNGVSHHGP